MRLYKQKRALGIRDLLVGIAIFAVLVGGLFFALTRTNDVAASQQEEQLRQSIVRAAVTCYAIEGVYPANLEYIMENYGVVINEKDFRVRYEVFASNIMPEVSVSARGGK